MLVINPYRTEKGRSIFRSNIIVRKYNILSLKHKANPNLKGFLQPKP